MSQYIMHKKCPRASYRNLLVVVLQSTHNVLCVQYCERSVSSCTLCVVCTGLCRKEASIVLMLCLLILSECFNHVYITTTFFYLHQLSEW